jgi:hypothetical protein
MQRSSWYSFVWAAAVVACVVLVGPQPLRAGGCYSAASYSYGYASYPSYSYSYSYPATTYYASSYTPTYSYTPSYEVKEVVVPKAVRAYVSPDYFSSVSDYYKDRLLVDAIAGKNTDATKLKEELAELKAQIKGLSAAPAPQSYAVPAPYQYPQALPQQPAYQQPYSQQTYAQPPQSQAPQGQTPCDWRAQQAYQQGVQAAQQQYSQNEQAAQAQRAAYDEQQLMRYGRSYTQQAQAQRAAYEQQQQYERSYTQPGQYQPQGQRQPTNGYDHQGPPAPQPTQSQQGYQPPQAQQGYQSQQGQQGQQAPYISPRNQAAPGTGQVVPEAQARNHAPAPLPSDYGPVPDGLSQTVSESCLRCHGDNNESAGHGFDLRDLRSVPVEDRMESYALVASGEMPSRAQPLPRDKVKLFKEWYRAAKKTQALRAIQGRNVATR